MAAVAPRDEIQSIAGVRVHRSLDCGLAGQRNGGGGQTAVAIGIEGIACVLEIAPPQVPVKARPKTVNDRRIRLKPHTLLEAAYENPGYLPSLAGDSGLSLDELATIDPRIRFK